MRLFPTSFHASQIQSTLAFTVLAGGILLSPAAAQNSGPAQQPPAAPAAQPAPFPPPAVFENRIPAAQLAFLLDYAGRSTKEVTKDKRFHALMKQIIPRTTYHYGRDMPLSETSETLLDGPPLPVEVRDGRYAMVASHGGPYLQGRGFVWFDLKEGLALGGVFFHPVNGEPTPTLAIFSRQLRQTTLSMLQLPAEFEGDLIQWATRVGIPPVTTRYFIPENGRKYVLLHDEDYCWHPDDAPPPDQDRCQQMNADAADTALSAAWFMAQTHNAANATAWMLGPEMVNWIAVRNRTCAAAGLPCRIRMTRQRTRAILGQN